jgi:hypothetical protein
MEDLLNRNLNALDLVLCYPGVGYLYNSKYGLVIGANKIFTQDSKVIQCSNCLLIGSLTAEQEKIRIDLIEKYRLYSQDIAKAGGGYKIVPEIGGVYESSSSQYYLIYLGRYTLHFNSSNHKEYPWKKTYNDGVYVYIKIRYNSVEDTKIKNYLKDGSLNRSSFLKFMNDHVIHNWLAECYHALYRVQMTGSSIIDFPSTPYNLVLSTKKRTFIKKLGQLNLSFVKTATLLWNIDSSSYYWNKDDINVSFQLKFIE